MNMEKEIRFLSAVTPTTTDSQVKKRKRSEAQIQQWETMRRQSTIVEDKDINIEGVVPLNLSTETQRSLGCVIGETLSSEVSWVTIKKENVEADLARNNENSEFFAIKDQLMALKDKDILVGYIFSAEKSNHLYICITEEAKKHVLELIDKDRAEQEKRVYNCIYKGSKEWIALKSDNEVEENKPKYARPLIEIQTITGIRHLNQPENFQDQNIHDRRDGYVNFDPRQHKNITVFRKRTDIAVQVTPEQDTSIAQTLPTLPSNIWTQYVYHVDAQKDIEDEESARSMQQFLRANSQQMADFVRYNSVFDLHKEDYPYLVKFQEDADIPKKITYREYRAFMDVKNCKQKTISSVSWHPMWTGVVACAYVEHSNGNRFETAEQEVDNILQDVFSTNPVLIWSFVDGLNPRLILGSPREVHCLQFCPFNENLLVGGCSSGQVVVWDLSNKLRMVEKETSLTPNEIKYRFSLYTLMGWIKPHSKHKYIRPSLESSLEFSPSGCIRDIKWLSPYCEISRLGRYHGLKSSQATTALQFLTCSEDGSVCVWDLHARGRKRTGIDQDYKKRRRQKIQYHLAVNGADSLSYGKMSGFRPHYKFLVEKTAGIYGLLPLSVIAVQPFPLNYVQQTNLDISRKLSMTERITYKPEFQKPKMFPKCKMYIGSMEGQVVQATWEGYEFNPGDIINSETLKYSSWREDHDGPVSSLCISPFNTDLVLSVGGKVFAIWREYVKNVILWRRSFSQLTSGAWSLFCPSMFYITRADGVMEIWDFLVQSNKPVLVLNITGGAVTGIYPSRLGPQQNLVAITDLNGAFQVYFLPFEHKIYDPKHKTTMSKFFNREVECRNFANERYKNWLEYNADMIHAKEKAAQMELKRREAERKAKERFERERKREEEELLEREKLRKIKEYVKEESAQKRWNLDQEKHLTEFLMIKKKLDKVSLFNKKAPLEKLIEDESRKRIKQSQEVRLKQSKFRERITVLFPGTLEESPPLFVDTDELKVLDEALLKFIEQYKEIEEKATIHKRCNIFKSEVSLKQVYAEGKERHCIMDVKLNSHSSKKRVYLKVKEEKKAAQSSELSTSHKKEQEIKRGIAKHGLTKTSDLYRKRTLDSSRKFVKRMGEDKAVTVKIGTNPTPGTPSSLK